MSPFLCIPFPKSFGYAAEAVPDVFPLLAPFSAIAWTPVHVIVLWMSATVQPLDKSLTGCVRPAIIGPRASAPVDCCTACTYLWVMIQFHRCLVLPTLARIPSPNIYTSLRQYLEPQSLLWWWHHHVRHEVQQSSMVSQEVCSHI